MRVALRAHRLFAQRGPRSDEMNQAADLADQLGMTVSTAQKNR